jgi:prepilin-type N-terminal cleavage/methylation domain-containing protein
MMNQHKSHHERGFTLTEILVALAVFTIILIGALVIYDRSNRVFKDSVEAADVQQNTRVAFDRLVADIRMAGFDYDRDGVPTGAAGSVWQPNKAYVIGNLVSPTTANGFTYKAIAVSGSAPYTSGSQEPSTGGGNPWPVVTGGEVVDNEIRWRAEPGINQYQQPDEQIEFAGSNAITIRGNFDFESDKANDYGREPDLQNAQFSVVTTGNDEIVTYALRSNNGPNAGSVQFYADVPDRRTYPGGRAENLVTINNVDFTNNNPPYTLYRFTLAADGTIVESPVANNIRRLDFTYYADATGNTPLVIPAASAGSGQYNPNNVASSAAARALRAQVKSVRVNLVGMNDVEIPSYQNPQEAVGSPARNYRTYAVESLVVPRNIGKQGFREPQSAAPGKPVLRYVDYGYCGIARVEWLAPGSDPSLGTVEQYAILYDTIDNGNFRFIKQVGTSTSAYITLDPNAVTYYFTVAAINSYGSSTAAENRIAVQLQNRTTPMTPASLTVSGTTAATEQVDQITLTWPVVTKSIAGANTILRQTPTGPGAAQPDADIAPGEIITYRVYRDTVANFTPSTSNLISASSPNTLDVGLTDVTFVDRSAAACVPYFYKVQAFEACDLASENIAPAVGFSDYQPAAAGNGIQGQSTSSASPSIPSGLTAEYYTDGVTPACVPTAGNTDECTVKLAWNPVKTDTSTPPIRLAIGQYRVTRVKETETIPGSGTYAPDGSITWTVNDANTVDATAEYIDTIILQDKNFGVTPKRSRYRYTVAAINCSSTSAASLEVLFPCVPASTPSILVTNTIDGNGTTPGSAWLMDGSGSAVQVSGGGISTVQAYLYDGFSIIDLGTDTSAPFDLPILDTEEGNVYELHVLVTDASGCVNHITQWVEHATPSGCCLAALADDSLVVEYSPGTNFVRLRLRNLCDEGLQVQPNGFKIEWTRDIDPAGTTNDLPVTAQLTTVDFPAATTGVVTQTLNTTNLSPPAFSLPGGARNPIPSEAAVGFPYEVVVKFSQTLLGSTSPVTNVCVSYLRASDGSDVQHCRVIPEPLSFNSCFN